jgi:hypothetical protein
MDCHRYKEHIEYTDKLYHIMLSVSSTPAGWYYLYFFKGTFGDLTTLLAVFGVDVGPGWSFYLVAAAGGGSLLLSIILMIIGCNMQTTNGAILPIQQPQTVIAMTGTNIQQGHNRSTASCSH